MKRSSVHRGSGTRSSLQSQPHLKPAPPLHYQPTLEPPINGGESSLDGICSIGKQQVFQFQSNYSIKKEPQTKQVSVTKMSKIKQDLFPKEIGLRSNKNQSKRSLDIHKDKGLLRVLQGRPSENPSKGYQDVPSQMKEGFPRTRQMFTLLARYSQKGFGNLCISVLKYTLSKYKVSLQVRYFPNFILLYTAQP